MIYIEMKLDKKQTAMAILTDKTCNNCVFPKQLIFETLPDAEEMIRAFGCKLKILDGECHNLKVMTPLTRTCEKFIKR